MNPVTMTEAQSKHVDDFVRRFLVHLPDSIEQRQIDLTVLSFLLPDGPAKVAVDKMQACLTQSVQAQKEFCFSGGRQ